MFLGQGVKTNSESVGGSASHLERPHNYTQARHRIHLFIYLIFLIMKVIDMASYKLRRVDINGSACNAIVFLRVDLRA